MDLLRLAHSAPLVNPPIHPGRDVLVKIAKVLGFQRAGLATCSADEVIE